MSSHLFFKELGDTFKNHPYQERFLEELQDHLDDAVEDLDDAPDHLLESIFDAPQHIKKTFVSIVDPRTRLFYFFEGLLLGFASFLIAYQFYDLLIRAYNSTLAGANRGLIYFFLFQLIFLAFYDPVFSLLQNIKPYTHRSSWFWFLCLFLPGFLFFMGLGFFDLILDPTPNAILLWPSTFLIYLFCSGGMGYLTLRMTNKRKKTLFNAKELKFIAQLFVFLLVGRTFITYLDTAFLSDHPWIALPFFPIFLLDIILTIHWNYISFNSIFPFYLPGIFLLFVFILELSWILMKPKKWLMRSVVLLYALSFTFVSPQFFEDDQFGSPGLNLSVLIEKERTGIFYPYMNYIVQLDHLVFASRQPSSVSPVYTVFTFFDPLGDPYFGIETSDGYVYVISQLNLDSKSKLTTFDSVFELNSDIFLKSISNSIHLQDEFIDSFFVEDTEYDLAHLDHAFSFDKKWLLIALPHPNFDKDELLLFSLES